MQRPTGWTFLLVSLMIPYSSMRSGTPTVMNPKLRDCFYDAERREFVTIFRDGKLYRVRRNWLQEDDGSEILRVHVESDGSAFRVEQASGHRFEVPWDFVLYHSEPRYQYYKGRRTQRVSERSMAAHIGWRVRELRQQKGLTTYELAKRSGILRPNISRIESGRHVPSVDTLDRLARALGVSPADLL